MSHSFNQCSKRCCKCVTPTNNTCKYLTWLIVSSIYLFTRIFLNVWYYSVQLTYVCNWKSHVENWASAMSFLSCEIDGVNGEYCMFDDEEVCSNIPASNWRFSFISWGHISDYLLARNKLVDAGSTYHSNPKPFFFLAIINLVKPTRYLIQSMKP